MRNALVLALTFAIACSGSRAPQTAPPPTPAAPPHAHVTFPSGPGVTFESLTVDAGGQQAVYFTEVAPNDDVVFQASMSNDVISGLERTSSQANRRNREGHRAVAAINADFWGPGDVPLGIHIENGELFTDGPSRRPAFGVEADGDRRLGPVDVETKITRPDGVSMQIPRVNGLRVVNSLVLYTARFGERTGTDDDGTEVMLQGPLTLRAHGELEATVGSVRSAGNSLLGAGAVVISGSGEGSAFLQRLRSGDRVRITTTITSGWEEVIEAAGGGHVIVSGGKSVAVDRPNFAEVKHPRTAVGLKADGTVVLAVVDGRQPGYSTGMTLPELATLMLDRGAVEAVNFDGGGSSSMAVRIPGTDGVTLVNRGSDGFERGVSNSLVVISRRPTGLLSNLLVTPSRIARGMHRATPLPWDSLQILRGSRIALEARGHDTSFNSVALDPGTVQWSTRGGIGGFSGGLFTASGRGRGSIVARSGNIEGELRTHVVTRLTGLEITPSPLVLPPGGKQSLAVTGSDARGEVFVDPATVRWSVTGEGAQIERDVTLSATSNRGSVVVTADIGPTSATAKVEIGLPPKIIEDFDDISDMTARAVRATATLMPTMRPNPVRSGTRSARLHYVFTNAEPGTSAAYAVHDPPKPIEGRPVKFGVWVYGDARKHWLVGNYRDGSNAQKVVRFTEPSVPTPIEVSDCARRHGGIDWEGWKYVEGYVPADAVLPLKWERIYVVETNDICDGTSSIYLDDLRAIYFESEEDLIGPSITGMAPEGTVYTPRPEIRATIRDAERGSGLDPKSVQMTIDDVRVTPRLEETSGHVVFTPDQPFAAGDHRVRLMAADQAGNAAIPVAEWTFRVHAGPDTDPPRIDRMLPLSATTSRIDRPRVSARVSDPHRGVNAASIVMTVDGEEVAAVWDPGAAVVWHAPARSLAPGRHDVTLRAADAETPPNVATTSWHFNIDPLPTFTPPYVMTFIADGGYFEGEKETPPNAILREHLAREARQPPALLLFGGDIVENDRQINYDRAVRALDAVPVPRLVVAGNHEISGSLSRERFWRTFGPTIGAHTLGRVEFIITDTASSSFTWDRSQWAWLEGELARTQARTTFLLLHVPPRDPFLSGHGLPEEEGARLERLLAGAAAARPDRQIIVLSGDAHAYGSWQKDGVTYVISGGGGGGPDARPEAGGFYHRLRIGIDGDGRASLHVIPLFEWLSIDAPPAMRAGERRALSARARLFNGTPTPTNISVTAAHEPRWASSDERIVRIDAQGMIEAVAAGTATITVESGDRQAQVKIDVR